jgi:hypothetical protein
VLKFSSPVLKTRASPAVSDDSDHKCDQRADEHQCKKGLAELQHTLGYTAPINRRR